MKSKAIVVAVFISAISGISSAEENIFNVAHESCRHLLAGEGPGENGAPQYTPEFRRCFDKIVRDYKAKKKAEFEERCPRNRRTVLPMFQNLWC